MVMYILLKLRPESARNMSSSNLGVIAALQ